MANFFLPSPGSPRSIGFAAADNSWLSELIIKPGAIANFGLWGNGRAGEILTIKVYRAGQIVIDNPTPKSSFPDQNVQIFALPGLKNGDEIYGMLPDGVSRFTSALKIVLHANTATDVIADWAQHYKAGEAFDRPHLYPDAVPYLALSDKGQGAMARLEDRCIGGALNAVHGLAVHTTAGTDARSPFQTARWGCVPTWNTNQASAHFAISGDGTVIQFVPADWVAYAQGSPGNENWISVEIDNNGVAPMKVEQLTAAKALFQWVCRRYGVYPTLATGCLFPQSKAFDDMTSTVCQAAGADLTTNKFEAAMSRGLSCHWWLYPGQHACPGPGILSQLPSIAKPGPMS
jgi:hypothetical protein